MPAELDSFQEAFPGVLDENDPALLAHLRRLALVVFKKCLRGEIKNNIQALAAQLVMTPLLRIPSDSASVHLHITWREIEAAKRRVGLLPLETKDGDENAPPEKE